MAETTKFLHTHVCDMCGRVIAEDIPGALQPGLAVKFRLEAPGVRKEYTCFSGDSLSRTVLICKICQSSHTVEEFVVWLEETKE